LCGECLDYGVPTALECADTLLELLVLALPFPLPLSAETVFEDRG
jgi:hypothetical protein